MQFQLILLILLVLLASPRPAHAASALGKPGGPKPDYDLSSESGPHHRIQRIVNQTPGPAKTTILQTNQFTDIAIGLNYFNEGRWQQAEERIDLVNGLGVASRGQHKVVFLANLNTSGALDVEMPDGKHLLANVAGLSYFDPISGGSTMIAATKDSVGRLVPPNKIIYEDAFDDVLADVIYEYTRSGLSQYVVLRECPPPPSDFNLPDDSTRLEVWSEFIQPDQPRKTPLIVRKEMDPVLRSRMAEPDLIDEQLDFGTMQMLPGKAFMIARLADLDPEFRKLTNADDKPAKVSKKWQRIENEGRDFLIESVDYFNVKGHLETLPRRIPAEVPKRSASIQRELPQRLAARSSAAEHIMAQNPPDRMNPGFVLDFDLSGSIPSISFGSDTYHIIGNVSVTSSASFTGGSVLKYDRSASLTISGSLSTSGSSILTAVDDNSAGISLNGGFNNGNPIAVCGYYALTALGLNGVQSGASISGLDIRYAQKAIEDYSPYVTHTVTGCQFSNCGLALGVNYTTVYFLNSTYCNVNASPPYSPYNSSSYIYPSGLTSSSACADDWANCMSGVPNVFPFNTAILGNIERPWDEDFFRFQTFSTGVFDIFTTGGTDTYGYLLNASGSIISLNDDGQGSYGLNFHISSSALPAGTYYVRVRHYNSTGGTGPYTLFVNYTGNSSPIISGLMDVYTTMNTATSPMQFTVSDAETPAANLTITTGTSNPTLFPAANISVTGTGANRILTLTPAPNQTGIATITVTVTDGGGVSTSAYLLAGVTLANGGPAGGSSLINFNFGGGYGGGFNKAGGAVYGGTGDKWNNIVQNATAGTPRTDTGFVWADNSAASGVSLTINNAVGIWDSMNTGDAMMDIYLTQQYTPITLSIAGLITGSYEVYLYAHGANNDQFVICDASVNGTPYATKSTSSYPYNNVNWLENKQYVKWVVSINSGQTLSLTASPADNNNFFQSFSVVNGLQIHKLTTDSDADGLPDDWENQYFGNLTQNAGGDADGDGLSNLQEYQNGTHPNRAELTVKISRPRSGANLP